jgi:hypothetical protein
MSTNEKSLTERQELYCQAFTNEGETMNNQIKSYAFAFDYTLPLKEDGSIDTNSSEYKTCSVSASALMRDPKIQARIRAVFMELYNDDTFWDSQITRIARTGNNADILASTRHRNDLKARIVKKVDVTTAGRPLSGLSDDELTALAQ